MNKETLIDLGFEDYDDFILRVTRSMKALGYVVDINSIKNYIIKYKLFLEKFFADNINDVIPFMVFKAKVIYIKDKDTYSVYKERKGWEPNETTKRAMEESRKIIKNKIQLKDTPTDTLNGKEAAPKVTLHANGKTLPMFFPSMELAIEGKSNDDLLEEYARGLLDDIEEGYAKDLTKELEFFTEANKVFPNIFAVSWEYL